MLSKKVVDISWGVLKQVNKWKKRKIRVNNFRKVFIWSKLKTRRKRNFNLI